MNACVKRPFCGEWYMGSWYSLKKGTQFSRSYEKPILNNGNLAVQWKVKTGKLKEVKVCHRCFWDNEESNKFETVYYQVEISVNNFLN